MILIFWQVIDCIDLKKSVLIDSCFLAGVMELTRLPTMPTFTETDNQVKMKFQRGFF